MSSLSGLLSTLSSAFSDVRYWLGRVLTNPRTFAAIGLLALVVFLFLFADTLGIDQSLAFIVLGCVLLLWMVVYLVCRRRRRRANDKLGDMLEQQAKTGKVAQRTQVDALRIRLTEAVRTIKTSKIGHTSGNEALYELPWYIVIGNPAAGKSSAVIHSGLQFPFADKNGAAVRGVGGTRNCDWFFTTEGILLDTAGSY